MNKRNTEVGYILEMRLQHWAAWVIKINLGEEGWPNESTLVKIAKGLIKNDNQFRTSMIPFSNPKAEEINGYINQMQRDFPSYADALRCYYLSRDKAKEIAQERKIATRTFYHRVKNAKNYIADKLTLVKK